jgi:hypothetical protein
MLVRRLPASIHPGNKVGEQSVTQIEHKDWETLNSGTWLSSSIMIPVIELMRRDCPENLLLLTTDFAPAVFAKKGLIPGALQKKGCSPFRVCGVKTKTS